MQQPVGDLVMMDYIIRHGHLSFCFSGVLITLITLDIHSPSLPCLLSIIGFCLSLRPYLTYVPGQRSLPPCRL